MSVRDLAVSFHVPEGVARAVDGVSFDVEREETVALVGESGSGKSVTALALLRLLPDPPARIVRGRILFDTGDSVADLAALPLAAIRRIRGRGIAMIFQEPDSALNPVFTVGDQIAEVARVHAGLSRREAMDRAIAVLGSVGLDRPEERARSYPHELSGGMKQRAMIAMALVMEPRLLVADEPTTALDVTIQAQILDLLRRLRIETGMALLLITHDLGVVARAADRVAVMYAGRIVETAGVRDLLRDPVHPYTQGLLACLPSRVPRGARIPAIEGGVPSPFAPPPGCRFHPRCGLREPACAADMPELEPAGERRGAACPPALRRRAAGAGSGGAGA